MSHGDLCICCVWVNSADRSSIRPHEGGGILAALPVPSGVQSKVVGTIATMGQDCYQRLITSQWNVSVSVNASALCHKMHTLETGHRHRFHTYKKFLCTADTSA